MHDKILVTLDGSELAEAALPYAEELAGKLPCEIRLLYVGESPEDRYQQMRQPYIEEVLKTTKQNAERYLEKRGVSQITAKSEIIFGHPAEKIVEYAEKEDIGLIVMATHGRSGIRRWAIGSVVDKVVRATTRPVLLIRAEPSRPEVHDDGLLKRILIPLDGSKESEMVLEYIAGIISKLEAEAVLLHVLSPTHYIPAAELGSAKVYYTDVEIEQIKASAADYLGKVASGLKGKGITAKSEVAVGATAESIINLANEMKVGAVAMSTHGRSGIGRLVLGSVADKVLQQGNSPLLLVRVPA